MQNKFKKNGLFILDSTVEKLVKMERVIFQNKIQFRTLFGKVNVILMQASTKVKFNTLLLTHCRLTHSSAV